MKSNNSYSIKKNNNNASNGPWNLFILRSKNWKQINSRIYTFNSFCVWKTVNNCAVLLFFENSRLDSKFYYCISSMDVNNCLPPELTVQSVEHILHRIGLTLDSTKSYPKRNLFFNPIIVFITILLFIIREVIFNSLNEENDLIFKIFGSLGYLMGIRREMSIIVLLFSILPLSFQLIYYYNYRNGIKPTFSSCIPNDVGFGFTEKSRSYRWTANHKTIESNKNYT